MRKNDEVAGLIHIYAGDGKGKTTAAIGLAVRACGAGKRVGFYQFMKGRSSSELAMLDKLGIVVVRDAGKEKFVFQMDGREKAEYRDSQSRLFREAAANAAGYDVLVFDELTSAISLGMVPEDEVLAFLDGKPAGLEVVITGRDPGEGLLGRAQYVSEIRCIRHPYECGVSAREGIEF